MSADGFVRGILTSDYLQLCSQDGSEVRGSTVGIVGMGSIGLATARLLKAFGATILYHNRNRRCVVDLNMQNTIVNHHYKCVLITVL